MKGNGKIINVFVVFLMLSGKLVFVDDDYWDGVGYDVKNEKEGIGKLCIGGVV